MTPNPETTPEERAAAAYMDGRPQGTARTLPRPDLPWTAYVDPLSSWPVAFHSKLSTAAEALRAVHSGQRVYIGGGCGEPLLLSQELVRRGEALHEVEVIQILTAGQAPYAAPELAGRFRVNALFIGSNVRAAVGEGRADFTPVFLSEIPRLFRAGHLPIDVALISLSPPDSHGYCSFGVEVGVTQAAVENARIVIAEINPHMPRVWGNSFIHLSRIDRCVLVDYPLPEMPQSSASPVYSQIGRHVADLVEDGATLQLGIGAIPDAVLPYLAEKRDLGIHSEMISDGIIGLIESGVITGRRKTLLPGKVVASFMLGTRRLYEFVHDNPVVELHPSDYTNDPFIISRNDKMVAINSALQIDLTGQVCADSIGTRFYSGVGGQADFMRGAARSPGGKPIIAVPATAMGGAVSRIVSTLEPGAGVTTTRNDVHYVVTEYGVADLYGKSVRQRARALIGIAHPDFRADLRAAAEARNLL
ncbi:MAG TPA: acetyl-CoA hydrolase/transferase C-terminal domain-containing protein [Chloroflexia bacterium]|nr:acetyl-CoA hydrolase/transferase C-terminal domain-containing protein [Chloroflexia bacterium]